MKEYTQAEKRQIRQRMRYAALTENKYGAAFVMTSKILYKKKKEDFAKTISYWRF